MLVALCFVGFSRRESPGQLLQAPAVDLKRAHARAGGNCHGERKLLAIGICRSNTVTGEKQPDEASVTIVVNQMKRPSSDPLANQN
ncbi:hypothetical protein KVT40_000818 [Elsinoe batatas]|uniref:Uncharacterized protein n=1 Tax=Elsinoe batatas TaxID=2601811 RepID=A0A8K0PLG8_9PEZI|nr:hypothetical protein KVT40_000818 [Elsinoe batatas]